MLFRFKGIVAKEDPVTKGKLFVKSGDADYDKMVKDSESLIVLSVAHIMDKDFIELMGKTGAYEKDLLAFQQKQAMHKKEEPAQMHQDDNHDPSS